MTEREKSLTELFAEHIVRFGLLYSPSMCESFAEDLAQSVIEDLPENVEVRRGEWGKLVSVLTGFVEDELADGAVDLIREWNKDAAEYEDAKLSAIYGR